MARSIEHNRQWRLRARPTPDEVIGRQHFDLVVGRVPQPGPDQLLVRTLVLGTSPAQRAYTIEDRRFHGGVDVGDVMHGRGIGVVEASNHPEFQVGDWVTGSLGWQEWALLTPGQSPRGGVDVRSVQKVDASLRPASLHLGCLGNAAFAALYGLETVGEISAGKTVLVSAAAGGVGAMAGQIAKVHGCRAVGIAGGPRKVAWLTDLVGYDAAIDYQRGELGAALDHACPDGIDVYFDNVGGPLLDLVLQRLKVGARIVLCGLIATEYLAERPPGPAWYSELIYKRARMEGFVIWDQVRRYGELQARLKTWYDRGLLKPVDHISHGIETMPDALNSLFTGANTGIRLVQVGEED